MRRRVPPATQADVDARYGLEPVFEPGDAAELGRVIVVDCPDCGERFETPVDLTAGSFSYVEDCQVCCRPIELSGEVSAAGVLRRTRAQRLD